MLDYGLTEYQTAIRDLAREITDKEIRPVAAEYDREGQVSLADREDPGGRRSLPRLH